MVEQEKQSSTITYRVKVAMQALAIQMSNPLAGAGNGSQMPILGGGGQKVLQALYDCEVGTAYPPTSEGFEELAASVGKTIQSVGMKAHQNAGLTPPDHVEIAHTIFLTLVEEHGKDKMVRVSGGGTGMVNGDTRGFIADHDPAMVYLDAGG